jgi:hypothetical protein
MTDEGPHPVPDYLWDRSGHPEPDLVRLEQLLGGIRERCPIPELGPLPTATPRRRPAVRVALLAAAAAGVFALAGPAVRVWLTPWTATTLDGVALVDQRVIAPSTRVRAGNTLATGPDARVLLQVGAIGRVEIAPGSQVRVVTTNQRAHRLALDWGRLTAVIDAPPRWFIVDTPGAVAIDLGCAYVLEADRNGDGILSVTEGWVQLEGRAYNPIVPAGADARTRRGQEPGSPHYHDASSEFVAALAVVDFGAQDSREAALRALLAQARPRDSLTLLSLLGRLSDADRAAIYPRLAVLLPPPPGVTRDRIVAGDRPAIDRWWEALALPRPRKIYPRLWGFGR